MENLQVTAAEAELIQAVRNYKKAYPNGYPELLWYAQQLFDALTEVPSGTQN